MAHDTTSGPTGPTEPAGTESTTTTKRSSGNEKNSYAPPTGSSSRHELRTKAGAIAYTASADWLVLRKKEKPRAEMFSISYIVDAGGSSDPGAARPLTFVFNGGPGASSVYLHLGAMGPRRAQFTEQGLAPPPPYTLTDNESTWLEFTDLVFIDPIGTGFSRMIDDTGSGGSGANGGSGSAAGTAGGSGGGSSKDDEAETSEYWQLKRDLESLGEFIRKYLSRFHRWDSPIYVAGESYGGFRAAKLTKLLQQDYGVGLAGAVIISPAMEFTLLDGSDYDALPWIDTFPTMAGAAWGHGKSRKKKQGEDLRSFMTRASEFAVKELLPVLAVGDLYGEDKKERVLRQAADFIGLDRDVVKIKNGRVSIDYFVKNLLREQRMHLGLYDASLKVSDPYSDRDSYSGPDPTLHHVERVFAAGINTQLRKAIGLETERDYNLLSLTVNKGWKIDTREHALDSQVGATDDLRYGMSLNPHMKVYICHGIFDLVTPYFAAERITHLMKLTAEQQRMLTVKHYDGGHMFYTWDSSRAEFASDMRAFYSA